MPATVMSELHKQEEKGVSGLSAFLGLILLSSASHAGISALQLYAFVRLHWAVVTHTWRHRLAVRLDVGWNSLCTYCCAVSLICITAALLLLLGSPRIIRDVNNSWSDCNARLRGALQESSRFEFWMRAYMTGSLCVVVHRWAVLEK